MEQDNPVAGDDAGVHAAVGEQQRGAHEPDQLGLDVRVVDEVLPGALELHVGQQPMLSRRNFFLPEFKKKIDIVPRD